MADDHYYAWIRVGDGEPEPAVITGKPGARQAVTFGCPDPFYLDVEDPAAAIVLVVNPRYSTLKPANFQYVPRENALYGRANEMTIRNPFDDYDPPVEVTKQDAAAREAAYKAEVKRKPHNYAGFGRKGRVSG